MTLIQLIVAVLCLGLVFGAVDYVFGEKMTGMYRRAFQALSVLVLVFLVLSAIGLMPALGSLRIK